MCCKTGKFLCVNQLGHPAETKQAYEYINGDYVKSSNTRFYLSVWGVTCSSNHFMQFSPVNYLTIRYVPNADLGVKGTTDEVSIIYWIELNTSHCETIKSKKKMLVVTEQQVKSTHSAC